MQKERKEERRRREDEERGIKLCNMKTNKQERAVSKKEEGEMRRREE